MLQEQEQGLLLVLLVGQLELLEQQVFLALLLSLLVPSWEMAGEGEMVHHGDEQAALGVPWELP